MAGCACGSSSFGGTAVCIVWNAVSTSTTATSPKTSCLSAALTVAARHVDDTDLKTDARRLAHTLANICEPKTRDADSYVRRIHYGRRNARYRPAHELAILVLRGLAIADLFDTSSGRITALTPNMNTVFEEFVSRLVADSLEGSGLEVSAKESLSAVIVDDDTGNTYSTLRPDLVVLNPERAQGADRHQVQAL